MFNKINISNDLVLRKLTLKNIDKNYLSWLNDTSLEGNLVNINFKDINQLREYYKKTIKKKYLFFFGIFYKGKHIGNIKFENIYFNSSKASWGILIGNKRFRGKKIGSKVLAKSMDYFERKLNIKNFIISVSHRNLHARNLYYNLGFRTFKIEKDKIYLIKKCLPTKIILGSAHFENYYGARKINLKKNEVKNILTYAKNIGINFIDTANNYGKSEKIIGMYNLKNFEIISKLPKLDKNTKVKNYIERKIKDTLKKTRTKSIYGYLVHNSGDLLSKRGKAIIKSLLQIKKKKLVKKIGVSVYEVKELKKILKLFKPDIIQVPINILNQSFLKNNFLKKIKKLGIEIHCRSIFLQGMLLDNKVKSYSQIVAKKVKEIDKICKKNNIIKLNFLLNFIYQIKEIDKVVVGVDSVNQLKKVIKFMQKPIRISNFRQLAITNPNITDPRLWLKN